MNMKTSIKLLALLVGSTVSFTAMATEMPNEAQNYQQHQRPPFSVVKKIMLQRMEMAEHALPSRIQCVENATGFKELHACFPEKKGWQHHGPKQEQTKTQ